MDAEDAEVHVEPYNIPSDKLYGVVELVIDKPNEEGETDVETYVTPAASNWLRDVKREESDDGQTRYFANCLWPRNESKLSSYLEKRSKPADDWVVHSYVRILKFCRSIGQAKEQTKLALENATLLDSDVGLGKRLSLPPPRFGFGFGFSNLEDHRKTSASDTDDEPPPIRGLKVAQAASITRLGRNKRSHHHSDDDNDQRKSVKKSVISSSDSDTEDKTPKENPVSEPSSTGTKNPENGLNLKKVSPNKEIDSDIMTTPKRNKDTNVCAARKTASFSPNKMKLMSSSRSTIE